MTSHKSQWSSYSYSQLSPSNQNICLVSTLCLWLSALKNLRINGACVSKNYYLDKDMHSFTWTELLVLPILSTVRGVTQ